MTSHVNYILCKLLKNYSLHKDVNMNEVSLGEAKNKNGKEARSSFNISKTLLFDHNSLDAQNHEDKKEH